MSGSVNKVILVGNLGFDPEIRRTQDGRAIVNLRLATSESWRDKQTGERREKTEWHRVVIFNDGLAKVAEQYLKKGSKVYVEGQLQTREWEDKEGQKRTTTEVVLQGLNSTLTMLDSPRGGSGGGRSDDGPGYGDDGGYSGGGGGYGGGRGQGRVGASGGERSGGFDRGGSADRAPARSKPALDDMDDEIPF